jgi:hypothetical protein
LPESSLLSSLHSFALAPPSHNCIEHRCQENSGRASGAVCNRLPKALVASVEVVAHCLSCVNKVCRLDTFPNYFEFFYRRLPPGVWIVAINIDECEAALGMTGEVLSRKMAA